MSPWFWLATYLNVAPLLFAGSLVTWLLNIPQANCWLLLIAGSLGSLLALWLIAGFPTHCWLSDSLLVDGMPASLLAICPIAGSLGSLLALWAPCWLPCSLLAPWLIAGSRVAWLIAASLTHYCLHGTLLTPCSFWLSGLFAVSLAHCWLPSSLMVPGILPAL